MTSLTMYIRVSHFCLSSTLFVGVFIEYSVWVIYPRRAGSIKTFQDLFSSDCWHHLSSLFPSLPSLTASSDLSLSPSAIISPLFSSVVSSLLLSRHFLRHTSVSQLTTSTIISPYVKTDSSCNSRCCQHCCPRLTLSLRQIIIYFA